MTAALIACVGVIALNVGFVAGCWWASRERIPDPNIPDAEDLKLRDQLERRIADAQHRALIRKNGGAN